MNMYVYFYNIIRRLAMIGNAYIMVVLGIIVAKGLGFYRDMVFAGVFGTEVVADIYFQVFGLVNLIFTGIGVALSTLVIKNINQPRNLGYEKEYAASFLRKSFIYLICGAALVALFARQIVGVILPDISGADFELALKLMYIMIPSLIFVVIAYIISGVLQNEKVYFITSIMSLPFNAIIILSLFMENISITTIGLVTTIGWFLHIVILLPSFYKKGYSLFKRKAELAKNPNGNGEIIWIFISNMMFQICFYSDRAFVSGTEGMAATFNYASNLFVTISSVFVVAMSTVVFPSISKNYEEGNIEYVNKLLKYIITVMVAIFLPFLLVVGFFGTDIIRLIYERGSFTADSTSNVALMFFIYSLGILGYVSQELFNKILYLAGKYKYTVVGTIIVIFANVIINALIKSFVSPDVMYGSISLSSLLVAVSTSLLLTLYAVAISFGIKTIIGSYWKKDLLSDILKIFISGIVAFAVYVVFNIFMPGFTHGYLTFVIPMAICALAYVTSLIITGVAKKLLKREKEGTN